MKRRTAARLFAVLLVASLIGCETPTPESETVAGAGPLASARRPAPPLPTGYGPDGSFYAPPSDGTGKPLATYWPIVFSHAFSVTAQQAFTGDNTASGGGEAYGVKTLLETAGAIVYQPDKIAYGSNETRGQLLYKKCAGTTLDELLCKGSNPQVVDGVHAAILDYCGQPVRRARNGFADEGSCRRGLKFNLICHSQGCLDSRYLLAAVRNEFSGELMYKHIVSWTAMAGANKGTAQSDVYLALSGACAFPGCKSPLFDAALAADSLRQNQALVLNGGESAVALSRKYLLLTTDMDCDPGQGVDCAPSFNALYPLPEDRSSPVYYQTFSSQIFDINHPCYSSKKTNWQLVMDYEGPNDGNISVDSQKFTTYGWGSAGPATPVVARWVDGIALDPGHPHPGLEHMAYSDLKVPGMDDGRMSCNGEDNSLYRFSREDLYRDIVAELVERGF